MNFKESPCPKKGPHKLSTKGFAYGAAAFAVGFTLLSAKDAQADHSHLAKIIPNNPDTTGQIHIQDEEPTLTPIPSETPTPIETLIPTFTSTFTETPTSTSTLTLTPTETSTPTFIPIPTSSPTATFTPILPSPTPTPTFTPTATEMPYTTPPEPTLTLPPPPLSIEVDGFWDEYPDYEFHEFQPGQSNHGINRDTIAYRPFDIYKQAPSGNWEYIQSSATGSPNDHDNHIKVSSPGTYAIFIASGDPGFTEPGSQPNQSDVIATSHKEGLIGPFKLDQNNPQAQFLAGFRTNDPDLGLHISPLSSNDIYPGQEFSLEYKVTQSGYGLTKGGRLNIESDPNISITAADQGCTIINPQFASCLLPETIGMFTPGNLNYHNDPLTYLYPERKFNIKFQTNSQFPESPYPYSVSILAIAQAKELEPYSYDNAIVTQFIAHPTKLIEKQRLDYSTFLPIIQGGIGTEGTNTNTTPLGEIPCHESLLDRKVDYVRSFTIKDGSGFPLTQTLEQKITTDRYSSRVFRDEGVNLLYMDSFALSYNNTHYSNSPFSFQISGFKSDIRLTVKTINSRDVHTQEIFSDLDGKYTIRPSDFRAPSSQITVVEWEPQDPDPTKWRQCPGWGVFSVAITH